MPSFKSGFIRRQKLLFSALGLATFGVPVLKKKEWRSK
jgi:hypothetical protein